MWNPWWNTHQCGRRIWLDHHYMCVSVYYVWYTHWVQQIFLINHAGNFPVAFEKNSEPVHERIEHTKSSKLILFSWNLPFCRRGRSVEWYNICYGQMIAQRLAKLRASLAQPRVPESNAWKLVWRDRSTDDASRFRRRCVLSLYVWLSCSFVILASSIALALRKSDKSSFELWRHFYFSLLFVPRAMRKLTLFIGGYSKMAWP
jgi:hypothetical protein